MRTQWIITTIAEILQLVQFIAIKMQFIIQLVKKPHKDEKRKDQKERIIHF